MYSLLIINKNLKHFFQNQILQKITFAPSSMPKASGLKTFQNQINFLRYYWITSLQPKIVRKVLPGSAGSAQVNARCSFLQAE